MTTPEERKDDPLSSEPGDGGSRPAFIAARTPVAGTPAWAPTPPAIAAKLARARARRQPGIRRWKLGRALAIIGVAGLAFATLTGCGPKIIFDTPIAVDDTFARVKADAAALARYEAAKEYSEAHNGLALMIIEGNEVVYESYYNGYTAETPHHLFSGTKSFSCAMAMAMVEDGLLDLDEAVADTIDEFAGDPEREEMRVRDLLNFTSGIDQDWMALSVDGMRVNQRIEDKYAYAIGLDQITPPGSTWRYGSSHLAVFGELVKRKTGRDPVDYLEERVLQPIGMRYAGWHRDPAGNPMLAYGAWTTANEWAKFGVLARDDGMWEGERILPEGAFAECAVGSDANPVYGLTFWLNEEVPDDVDLSIFGSLNEEGRIMYADGAPDGFAAAGHNDQRLFMVPSLDLVVVHLSDGDRNYEDSELIRLLLED